MLSQTGKDKKGFTLIELMIVVAIIGILAAIAIPQFAKMREKAHDASAQSALANLRTAQETYYLENNRYMSITDNYQEWYEPEENLRLNIVRVTEGTVDVGWTASASYKGSSSKFVYDSRTGKMDKKDIDAIEDEEEDGEEDT